MPVIPLWRSHMYMVSVGQKGDLNKEIRLREMEIYVVFTLEELARVVVSMTPSKLTVFIVLTDLYKRELEHCLIFC